MAIIRELLPDPSAVRDFMHIQTSGIGYTRFVRTLKQECVWLHHFESFEQAERIITAWIDRYNTERQHSALRYLTPRAWREQFYQLPQAA